MMNLCFSLYENKFKKKPLPTSPKGKEYKQPLMIANETLIGTLMKTEILTNNYTINYTNIIRRTLQRTVHR